MPRFRIAPALSLIAVVAVAALPLSEPENVVALTTPVGLMLIRGTPPVEKFIVSKAFEYIPVLVSPLKL